MGQCEVEQHELEDFLAAGKDLKVSGLMEDVNIKYFEMPRVDNSIEEISETQETVSNFTDETIRLMSPQKNYREESLIFNQ